MPEMHSAAQSRDRRRVNALANSVQRAIAGIDLVLDGMSEREKLVALHVALERQLRIDKGLRHAQDTETNSNAQMGLAGRVAASATLDRSGRSAASRAA